MKVEINANNITDSPYNKENVYINNNENIVSQTIQEISNGTPTCYLVSGYRGSGKTSLIKKMEEEITSNSCFAYVNIPRYEKHEYILRKIIRSLFFSIKDNDKSNLDYKKIEALYKKTFYSITNKFLAINTSQLKQIISFKTNILNILLFLILVIAGFNIKIDFIPKLFGENTDLLLFYTNLIVLILKNIDIQNLFEITKKRENTSESIELYDNDIAEYLLIDFLKSVKSNSLKITIVIDELDKISNDSEVLMIINELKPLLLSGLCNFILITGQKTFYNMKKSEYIDDNPLSCIFSKILHTRLFEKSNFISLFELYLKHSELIKEIEVQRFLDSLVLQSNRIPRKFINLIRQSITWENDKPYINIIDLDSLYIDSIILSIIDEIRNKNIEKMKYSEPIKDFFIIQLHIFIRKIKNEKKQFQVSEVFSPNDYEEMLYPFNFELELNQLFNDLLSKLCDHKVLKLLLRKIDSEEVKYYYWIKNINDRNDKDFIKTVEKDFEFMKDSVYRTIRSIYSDLFYNNSEKVLSDNFKEKNINHMVDELKENKILTNNNIKNIIDNSLFNSMNYYSENDNQIIKNYKYNLSIINYQITEDYYFAITKDYLKIHDFILKRSNMDDYDFIANKQNLNIYFEVKTGQLNQKVLDNFFSTKKEYSILIYSAPDDNNTNYTLNRLYKFIQNKNISQGNYMILIYREYNKNAYCEDLKGIIDRIQNNKQLNPTNLHL